jgi:hypothetical protein
MILFEVSDRRDGHTGTGVRHYPPGNGQLPERERWRAINLAHHYHCAQGLSIRQTQAALAQQHHIRRSTGRLHHDLTAYGCDVCDPLPPPAAGWAGPAPA